MCNICLRDPCDRRCPNYSPPKTCYHCSICGDGILPGEEYIRNHDGDVIHFECITSMRSLLSWLGYDVKTVNDVSVHVQ